MARRILSSFSCAAADPRVRRLDRASHFATTDSSPSSDSLNAGRLGRFASFADGRATLRFDPLVLLIESAVLDLSRTGTDFGAACPAVDDGVTPASARLPPDLRGGAGGSKGEVVVGEVAAAASVAVAAVAKVAAAVTAAEVAAAVTAAEVAAAVAGEVEEVAGGAAAEDAKGAGVVAAGWRRDGGFGAVCAGSGRSFFTCLLALAVASCGAAARATGSK